VSTSGSKTDEGPAGISDLGISDLGISDLELMRYLDGELDEPELTELEARLAGDDEASGKLDGLEQLGDFLRQTVASDERGDAIADAVMVGIDAADSEQADSEDRGAEEDAEVIELPAPKPKLDPVAGAQVAPPANDNSRLIYSVFAAAAAVAIGLFVWGSTGPGADTVAMTDRPASEASEAAAAPEASPAAVAAEAARAKAEGEAAADDDDEPVVEIAAVDFGAQSGSVFYVSAGKNAAGSTAVVWVTDLGDER